MGNYILDASGRHLTLWDIMERFFADRFELVGFILGLTRGYGTFSEEGELGNERESFLKRLRDAKISCEITGLRVSAIHLDEVIKQLESGKAINRRDFGEIGNQLHESIRREMKATTFFQLSFDTQNYFEVAEGFGTAVANAFRSAEYDIKEAGNCLALSRATACVFHSMRILEHGLCALADKFGIPFEHKSWNDVIEPIEKAIRQIKNQPQKPPNWKNEEQFYSEAATQFMYFKNAWRNYTAHAQFKYTETEAEAIFRHVRDFMKHISKRLKEKKAIP
jgi:hypothetical protein